MACRRPAAARALPELRRGKLGPNGGDVGERAVNKQRIKRMLTGKRKEHVMKEKERREKRTTEEKQEKSRRRGGEQNKSRILEVPSGLLRSHTVGVKYNAVYRIEYLVVMKRKKERKKAKEKEEKRD